MHYPPRPPAGAPAAVQGSDACRGLTASPQASSTEHPLLTWCSRLCTGVVQLCEVRVLQGLLHRDAFAGVKLQHARQQVDRVGVGVWEDLFELHTLQDRAGLEMSGPYSTRGVVAVRYGLLYAAFLHRVRREIDKD